jgi:hypothetical protein
MSGLLRLRSRLYSEDYDFSQLKTLEYARVSGLYAANIRSRVDLAKKTGSGLSGGWNRLEIGQFCPIERI